MNLIKKLNGVIVYTRQNDEDIIRCGAIINNFFYRNLYSKGISIKVNPNKTIKEAWLWEDYDGSNLESIIIIIYDDGSKDKTSL